MSWAEYCTIIEDQFEIRGVYDCCQACLPASPHQIVLTATKIAQGLMILSILHGIESVQKKKRGEVVGERWKCDR